MDKTEFYFRVLERYDHYISLADTKATTTLSLLSSFTVAATALVGWGLLPNDDKPLSLGFAEVILIAAYIIFVLCAGRAYVRCKDVLTPNTKTCDNNQATDETLSQLVNKESTIFYGSVSNHVDAKDFINTASSTNDEDRFTDLLGQIHTVAKITKNKMDTFKKIYKWLLMSFICVIAILICSLKIHLGQ